LRIAGAIDDPADPGMHDGAGAHGAGLQRHEQFATGQTVIAEHAGRIAQGGDFGMRRRIALTDRRVEAAPDDDSVLYDDRADRHFAQAFGGTGLRYRLAHEEFVTQPADGFHAYFHLPANNGFWPLLSIDCHTINLNEYLRLESRQPACARAAEGRPV